MLSEANQSAKDTLLVLSCTDKRIASRGWSGGCVEHSARNAVNSEQPSESTAKKLPAVTPFTNQL